MKKSIIFLIASLLALAVNCYAAGTARVSWNNNPDGDIKGYNVYYGIAPGAYSQSVYAGTSACSSLGCSADVIGLTEGETYFFALKAVDFADQESLSFSAEVSKHIESSYAIDNVSVSQVFINLESGSYDLLVMADGTYQITPKGNAPPTVSLSTISSEIIEGDNITLTATASDPENDPLSYEWYLDGIFYGPGAIIDLVGLMVGDHNIYCRVTDGQNTIDSNVTLVKVIDGPNIFIPSILEIAANYGDEIAVGQLMIINNGNGDMYWDVSTTSNMLSVNQVSGVNDATITVTADILGLEPGDYFGDIIVTSYDADNSPQTVPVVVIINDITAVTLTIPVGPNDQPWMEGAPSSTSDSGCGWDSDYLSFGNFYFQGGSVFTLTEDIRWARIRVHLSGASIGQVMFRNMSASSSRWKFVVDFANLSPGCHDIWIDLTTIGIKIGDFVDGIGFPVYSGDSIKFTDLEFAPNP